MPITTSSDEALALFIEARHLWECREQEKANALLEEALEIDPDFALAYMYYRIPSSFIKAKQLIHNVTQGEKLFIKAGLAYVDGDFSTCGHLYDSLVQLYPKDQHCWLSAGNINRNLDLVKAEQCYRKAIDIDPLHSGAHRRLGVLLQGMGRFDEADQAFQEYLELEPELGNSALVYSHLLLKQGRIQEGIKFYRNVLHQDPSSITAYVRLTWLHMYQDDFEDAMYYCQKIQEHSQNQEQAEWAISMAANIHFILGNGQKTMEIIDAAIHQAELEKNKSTLHHFIHQKGWILMGMNQNSDAILMFMDGLNLLSDSLDRDQDLQTIQFRYHGALSIAYAKMGSDSRAEHHLVKARSLYSSVEKSWTNLDFKRVYESANAFYRGDYGRAISEASIRSSNECVLCQYYQAKSYEAIGQFDKALEYYQMAYYSYYPDYTGLVFNACQEKLEEFGAF